MEGGLGSIVKFVLVVEFPDEQATESALFRGYFRGSKGVTFCKLLRT